jgi:methyl-accepting chemotaxis protein
MSAIANLKIGVRLTIGFAAVITLLIMLAVIGVTKISAINADTEIILHDRFVKVQLAQTVENEVNKQLRALRTALIVSDAALVEKELAKLDASLPVVAAAIDKLKATVHSEHGKATLKELLESRARFKEKEQQMVASVKAGRIDEARAQLVSDILPLQATYLAAIEEFAKSQADSMEDFGKEAAALASSAKLLMEVLGDRGGACHRDRLSAEALDHRADRRGGPHRADRRRWRPDVVHRSAQPG